MVYPSEKIRLDKLLAKSFSSRRDAKRLIEEGRVKVDGVIVSEGAMKVDFSQDIRVNNVRVTEERKYTYLLFDKPKGVICSKVRQRKDSVIIYDLLPAKYKKLSSVGRLDKDTTGLILITDDGQFSNRITHPSNKLEKEYIITSNKPISKEQVIELRNKSCGKSKRARVVKMQTRFKIVMVVIEGTKRMIRRMASDVGISVKDLRRVRIGPLKILNSKPGFFRHLSSLERKKLQLS